MSLLCPQCQSEQIVTRNYARRTGGAIGAVAGAASMIAGPPGTVIGGIAGAIIGGFIGALAGGSAGIALGEAIDNNVLDNYQCLSCQFVFSLHDDPPSFPFEP
jgi:uncharacterized membrane protein